jgi:hypothetical protein
MTPHWIPDLVFQNVGEDYPSYENRLYVVFQHDFIQSHPHYEGLQVSARRVREETDGKWAGFIHLTSVEDYGTHERIPDPRRCERIKYPRSVIDFYKCCPDCSYSTCEKPLVWSEKWKNRTRIHILVRCERYLVILEPHLDKHYCMLVTAYYLDHEHSYLKQLKRYSDALNVTRAAAATQETLSTSR